MQYDLRATMYGGVGGAIVCNLIKIWLDLVLG